MSEDLRQQLYANLDRAETRELLSILRTNDRVLWTETDFDLIREILRARRGVLAGRGACIWVNRGAGSQRRRDRLRVEVAASCAELWAGVDR